MRFIKKWLANIEKNKHLAKLKPNDEIIINCIRGYSVILEKDNKAEDYPFTTKVISNDVIRKLLWVEFKCNGNTRTATLEYDSKELRNYMLFNIYTKKQEKPKKKLTKEELEKQLEDAINSDNYEAASLINKKLANIKSNIGGGRNPNF